MTDAGCQIPDAGYRIPDTGFQMLDIENKIWDIDNRQELQQPRHRRGFLLRKCETEKFAAIHPVLPTTHAGKPFRGGDPVAILRRQNDSHLKTIKTSTMQKLKFGIQISALILAFPLWFLAEMKLADRDMQKEMQKKEIIEKQQTRDQESSGKLAPVSDVSMIPGSTQVVGNI